MILVGITGGIGHGKTSLAQAVAKCAVQPKLLETSTVIAEIIDELQAQNNSTPNTTNTESIKSWLTPLLTIVPQKLHQTLPSQALQTVKNSSANQKLFEYFELLSKNPQLAQQTIGPSNKEQYRPMLQWLGNFLVQNTVPTIWYDELIRRGEQAKKDGCDLCIIGGVRYPSDAEVIRRKGGYILAINRPSLAQTDLADPTERERGSIIPDTIISNDGNLAALNNCAQQIIDDLQSQALRKSYNTLIT